MNTQLKESFRPVFYPESIAVVGASKDLSKSGARYFASLVRAGYKGRLYPVNVREDAILGFRSYPGVSSISDSVDYVIIAVPIQSVPDVVDDCIAARVKTIQIFTAGFRETGTEEGIRIEQLVARQASRAGCRIIGPNCIGIVNPSVRIPYGPVTIMAKPGVFGFVSQSGGHGSGILSAAVARGIGLSKGVSFGNGCDLGDADFIEYLAADDETEIIGAYLEGTRNGKRLYRAIREATRSKPVIVWKGGITPVGADAAASHTGSLAAPYAVWNSAMKQAGAVNVESLDEFMDTALAFHHIHSFGGNRVAVISGIVDGGGGDSVSATDACVSAGMDVPLFTGETRARLNSILRPVGTILRNPLDLGNPGADLPILTQAIEAVAADPNIDLIMIQKHVDMLVDQLDDYEVVKKMNEAFIDVKNSIRKPIVVISPPGTKEAKRIALDGQLSEAGVPVYPSLERAAKAILNASRYYRRRATRDPD